MNQTDIDKLTRIRDRILGRKFRTPQALRDLFDIARHLDDHDLNKKIKKESLHRVREKFDWELYDIYKKCLLFDAPVSFDDYMLYVEFDREPQEKFYVPRRKVLKPVVNKLQMLDDGELDLLGLAMPPGVGKSGLGLFFMSYIMAKYPGKPNAAAGYSGGLTRRFYQRLLNMFEDEYTYKWRDVFPNLEVKTNAEERTIDLLPTNTNKRVRNDFSTVTCRGADGAWTGNIRIENCLYVDDIIEGVEEAMSPLRLEKKYNIYANQMKDRKKEGAFELHIGTRWAVYDVTGRLKEQYKDDPRAVFINIPALDEQGESNFDYSFGLGFSTKFFLDIKDSIDEADWQAKYMGEPFLREGLLLPADEVKTFNGVLPDGEPDDFVAWADVAWGGGDYFSMPFIKYYGNKGYVVDWVFNNGDKSITKPIVQGRLEKHLPYTTGFEANNGGHEYSDSIDLSLKSKGIRLNIISRYAATNKSKQARIMTYSPEIRELYFLDFENSTQEYRLAMRHLTTYSPLGKNKHDDAPDSLAGLVELKLGGAMGTVTATDRPY